jgi:hypothetical protein
MKTVFTILKLTLKYGAMLAIIMRTVQFFMEECEKENVFKDVK